MVGQRAAGRMVGAMLVAAMLGGCQSGFGELVSGPDEPSVALFAAGQDGQRAKAKAEFRAGNFGLAERAFRAVLTRNPADTEAWVGLAASYDRLGRFDLADKSYDKALAAGGRRAEIVNNMGYSRLLRGDHAGARRLFAEAATLSPGNVTIAANLALVDTL